MGQRNMSYSGPMPDVESQHVHHHHLYNSSHTMLPVPPPGNRTTFDPRYLPENHGQLPYVNTPHNCEHCSTLVMPPPGAGVSSVPVNHDQFPFLNSQQIFERNRSMFMDGPNFVFKRSVPVAVHNSSHLVHGGQLVQPVPPAGGFSWNRAHGMPYLQEMRVHGYQVAGMSRNAPAYMPPPPMRPHQGSQNVYHPPLPPPPMLPVQAQNMDIHLHLPSTSHRRSTRTSTTYPFQNDADPGPSFVGPALPHDAMALADAVRQQQLFIELLAMRHSAAHPRALPIEEVFALGELTGNADSGLSDNFISEHLKTKTFTSFRHPSEDLMPADEEPNLCVICQMEFEDQEKIGMLDCCHEYHVECIRKWLVVKNNCPICKSTALH